LEETRIFDVFYNALSKYLMSLDVDKMTLGADFLQVLLFPLPILIPQIAPYSLTITDAT
jgi:hypothetical protein